MIEIEVYARSAVSNIPSAVLWALLVVLIVGSSTLLWLKGWQKGKYSVARLMLVEWMLLVFGSAVIFRDTRTESAINLIPFWSYFQFADNSYLKEMVAVNMLNVVMFVPVGFLLKCGFNSIAWKQVLTVGLILSATIEILQFLLCKGLCEIDDLIHNVLGCMLGYGLCYMILKDDLQCINTFSKEFLTFVLP